MTQVPDPAHIGIDPVTITLVGGQILLIVTTIGSIILSVVTAMRMNSVKEQQSVNTSNLLTVAKDTEAIKGHVNSEKTASEGREALLRRENELLRELIADKKATAGLLAQAVAQRSRTPEPAKVEVVNTEEAPVPIVATDDK